MNQRFGRVAVVLLLIATASVAAHQAVTRSRAASASEARSAAITAAASRADAAIADLAASERAYVAPGQGLDFWANRVDEALASARQALAELGAPAAISRLDDFAAMDRRARDYIGNGQRTLAADLIFADGFEILATARNEAAAAAATSRAALTAGAARDGQIHLASIAALGVCALVAALLLLRSPRAAEPVMTAIEPVSLVMPARVEHADADDSIGAALDASLDGISPPEQAPESRLPGTAAIERPSQPLPPAVDLSSAAEVCVDIARLLDARDLQQVLTRVAPVLEANGVIVWMADRTANTLVPAVVHGYPASLLSRLGPLPLSENNPTTEAMRTASIQVVDGALAVPMLTSEGCTGVLALEIRDGKERASDLQSLARIVAAQLAATISGAAESAESRRAAEA